MLTHFNNPIRGVWWFAAALCAVVGLAGCSSDNGNGGTDGQVASVGTAKITPAEGGTLKSEDGRLTLVVPAGAVSNEIEISVRSVDAANVPAELSSDVFVGTTYELLPDGQTFDKPARLTIVGSDTSGIDVTAGVLVQGIATLSGGTLERAGNSQHEIDLVDTRVSVSADLSHFSMATRIVLGTQMKAKPAEVTKQIGETWSVETFSKTIEHESWNWEPAAASNPPAMDVIANVSFGDSVVGPLLEHKKFENVTVQGGEEHVGVPERQFVCQKDGEKGKYSVGTRYMTASKFGDAEKHSITISMPAICNGHPNIASLADTQVAGDMMLVVCLKLDNRYFPRIQFEVGEHDDNLNCASPHWHADQPVRAVAKVASAELLGQVGYAYYSTNPAAAFDDGDRAPMADPDEEGCGFGILTEVPQVVLAVPKASFDAFIKDK